MLILFSTIPGDCRPTFDRLLGTQRHDAGTCDAARQNHHVYQAGQHGRIRNTLIGGEWKTHSHNASEPLQEFLHTRELMIPIDVDASLLKVKIQPLDRRNRITSSSVFCFSK
jgi:hypothetical protein